MGGVTRDKADEQGISTMQLPLGEHIDMGSFSKVLAVNHVLSIVLNYQATKDWRYTFDKSVPGRKTFLRPPDEQPAEAPVTASAADSSAGASVPDQKSSQDE